MRHACALHTLDRIAGQPHRRRHGAVVAVSIGVLALAGCGSNGGSSTAADSGNAASGATVSVRTVGGQTVLSTSAGRTLYVSDQERGQVLCTSGACRAIWTPLTLPAGDAPSGPHGIASRLTTITLPNGTRQVALDRRPLYTFSFDHGAGQVNGEGQRDSFDGTDFTWHAATSAGQGGGAPTASTSPSPYSGGGAPY
jgi:predicted lipoprotein with Yx(FWY)xxD motif